MPRSRVRTCASTPAIPWTGTPGATRPSHRARREDKPIFLSIGYATCHWCHVMAHESFAEAAIGERLARDFIAIKVDREERPDVDRVYMAFVQATTGSGGWPLNVWLTPSLEPFYGGTYFPPRGGVGTAVVCRGPGRGGAGLARGSRRGADVGRPGHRPSARSHAGARPGAGADRPGRARSRAGRVGPGLRRAARRLRRRAEVSPAERAAVPAARARADRRARAARDGARHAAGDGARRHARSRRRRLPSLLGGRRLARAALREDALRPGATGPRLPRSVAGERRSVLRAGRRRHAALRRTRPARSRRRLLLGRGRRLGAARADRHARRARDRGRLLHLLARRGRRGARPDSVVVGAEVRRAAGRQRAVRSAG